jgi:outer membrane protein
MYKKLINILFIALITISNTGYAETKIGVVKLDVLFQEIPIYKESQTNLKNEFKPKADELKKIETSWNKLNDDYLKNERTMSKNERKAKIKEISDIENKFRTKQQSLQKELQGKQNSELQRIRVIVEKAINKYAKDNDYDLILRADGTTLFVKKYVDITQDIINILN